MRLVGPALLFALLAAGCDGKPEMTVRKLEAEAEHPSPPARSATPDEVPLEGMGVVLEAIDASSYTYLQLDLGRRKVWVAGPRLEVAAGDRVRYAQANPMDGFHSPTLDRTFDQLLFAGQVQRAGGGQAAMPPDGHGARMGGAHPPAIATGVEVPEAGSIPVPEGGQTVGEVYARKDELAGGTVRVRGTVVRFNANILGWNWLHVQDGTGEEGTNDLLVLTHEEAKPGDRVVIEGRLDTDRDVGRGLHYEVIVMDAAVEVE